MVVRTLGAGLPERLEAWIGVREEVQAWIRVEEVEKDSAQKYPRRAAKVRELRSQLEGMLRSLQLDMESWETISKVGLDYEGVEVPSSKLNDSEMLELLQRKRNTKELVARRNEAVEALEASKKCAHSANLGHLLRIGEHDAMKLKQLSRFKLDPVAVPEVDEELAAPEHEFNAVELLNARCSEITEIRNMKAFHQVIATLSVNLAYVISEVDRFSDYDSTTSVLLSYEKPVFHDAEIASSADLLFVCGSLERAAKSIQELVEAELDETLKLRVFQQASSAANELLEIAGRLLSPEIVERFMQLILEHLTAAANAEWKISRLFSLDSCVRDKSLPFPMGIARFMFLGGLGSLCGNCEFGADSWNREDMSEMPGAAGALAAAQSEIAKLRSQISETCGREFKGWELRYLSTEEKVELDSRAAIGIPELELHLERVVLKVSGSS